MGLENKIPKPFANPKKNVIIISSIYVKKIAFWSKI